MNFTYLYKDDPDMDALYGNITWIVPNVDVPAHWIHAEYICELTRRLPIDLCLKLHFEYIAFI